MSLLATQTCCSEHATRMAQEYLRCALVRDSEHVQRTAFGPLQEVWYPTVLVGQGGRTSRASVLLDSRGKEDIDINSRF
jgi:hypothetical protein